MDDVGQTKREAPLRPERLAAASLIAFVVAFAADLGVLWLGRGAFGVAPDQSVLSPLSIALTTLFGAAAAAVGLYALAAQAARPLRAFRRLATLALVLSLLGPLAAALGAVPDSPSVGAGTFVTLVVMHVVTMAIIVLVLSAAAGPSLRHAGRRAALPSGGPLEAGRR